MSSLFKKDAPAASAAAGSRFAAGKPRSPYRIMLVDDSAVIRGLMSRWIEPDKDIEIVRSVANGQQAVELVAASGAEVVILDIEMPVMDGITALPKILEAAPNVKVVMSSTLTKRGADITLKAMSLGAADYVAKPESTRGVTTSEEFRFELLDKVKNLAAASRKSNGGPNTGAATRKRAPVPASARPAQRTFQLRSAPTIVPRALAIASSTGGPQALFQVFETIGPKLSIPVFLTQHMPATFTSILAEHLGKVSGKPAKEAENGEVVKPATIYVAPGGKHMLTEKVGATVRLRLDDGPQVNFCKPAADPMFESIAETYGAGVLAVVLTGMGSDGCNGAKKIVDAGGVLIGQDETTSVVWGMPGAVAEAGICNAVLPLGLIGDKIMSVCKGGRV